MNQISRREFLAQGGLAFSIAAVLAACGDTTGPTGPGRVGNGDTGATLPTVTIDDTVIARTAQSLHHSVIDVYQRLTESELLPAAVATALAPLIEAHQTQAKLLDGSTGGAPFECPNPFVMDRYVEPTFRALDTAEIADPAVDSTKIALAFSEWITRSHQDLIGLVENPEMRSVLLTIGTEDANQAAILAVAAGEPAFSPTLSGGDPQDQDDNGYPIYYVIPAEFGQVNAVKIVVGEPDAEGQRYSINLQTPADNSFVLADTECK